MPDQGLDGKKILVLGAYGFIGAGVTRALTAQGVQISGLVRNLETGRRVLPGVPLQQGDLRTFKTPDDWQSLLAQADLVVNCAGALQDGPKDDLEAVHHRAIAALGSACARRDIAIIQVSAIGAETNADTEFMQTKAAGDAALQASGVRLWLLKPGLVIGQSDYGGTALLRVLAAVPVVQPIAYAQTPVQCIGMGDLCDAILRAARAGIPPGSYDLVEDSPHPLSEVVSETRRWLGFTPARVTIPMPLGLTSGISAVADLMGRLGWRSPLRRTAMAVMAQGVTGDPEPYRTASGRSMAGLRQIYDGLNCGREHRLSARLGLLMPVAIAVLSLFWVMSGLLGLIFLPQAAAVLTSVGWAGMVANASVLFWSVVDIALGLALLWRPWAGRACLAMVAVAAFYLCAASFTVPSLWADPLGPLLKVLPGLVLPLFVRATLESR